MDTYHLRYALVAEQQGIYRAPCIDSKPAWMAEQAAMNKRATVPLLRHNFTTHLMEQGVDTGSFQILLGHPSPKTTAIYAPVSTEGLRNIKSLLGAITEDKNLNNNNLKNVP